MRRVAALNGGGGVTIPFSFFIGAEDKITLVSEVTRDGNDVS